MWDGVIARPARPSLQHWPMLKQPSTSHSQITVSGSPVRLQSTPSTLPSRTSPCASECRPASVSSSLRIELSASVSVPASLRATSPAPPFLLRTPSRSLQSASALSCTTSPLLVPAITDMGLLSAVLLEHTQQAVEHDQVVVPQLETPRQFAVGHTCDTREARQKSNTAPGHATSSTKREHINYFFKTVDDAARQDTESECAQRVFGQSLAEARRAGACAAVQLYEHALDIPIVVAVSVQELERRASAHAKDGTLDQLNAFKSQRTREFESLVDFFDSCPTLNDCSLTQDDSQDVFELILLYLESLPRPLMDSSTVNQLVTQCVDASSEPPHPDRITTAQLVLLLLPTEEKHLLVFLMRFLVRLASVLAKGHSGHLDRPIPTASGNANATSTSRSRLRSVTRNDLDAIAKRFAQALSGTRSSPCNSHSVHPNPAGTARKNKSSDAAGTPFVPSENGRLESDTHASRAVLWLLKNWGDVLPGLFPRPDQPPPPPPPSQAPSNDSAATLAVDVENLRPPSPRSSWIKRRLSSKSSSNRKRHNDVGGTPPPPLPIPTATSQGTTTPRRPVTSLAQSQNQMLQSLKAEVGRLKRENAALRKDAAELRKANPRLAVENARLAADNSRLTSDAKKGTGEMKQLRADKARLAKRVEELERAAREREYGTAVERATAEETLAVAPCDQDVKGDALTATPASTSSGAQAKKLVDAVTNYSGQHNGNVIVGRRASALRRAIGLGPPAATTTASTTTASAKLFRKPPADKVAIG